MRLAYICQSYPPMISGASLVVRRLVEAMAAHGHEVLVIAASDRGPAYLEQRGALSVARLRSHANPFRVGQRFLLFPAAQVAAELRRFQPELIHLQEYSPSATAALVFRRILGVPAVLTLHQLPWFVTAYLPPLPGLRRGVEVWVWRYLRQMAQQCAAVITPSRMIAQLAAPHLGRQPVTLSNGVDLGRFSPQPSAADEAGQLCRRYGLDESRPVILYAGRIDADKRVDLAARAAAAAMQAVPAQFLVVGDGRQRLAVERLCRELGIAADTRFTGFVAPEGDLPGLYRLASVFITASTLEIQSSVVLEALASGTPVVTVDASSMGEFVQDGVNGYLAPPGDVEALGRRLVHVLRHAPEQRQAFRAAGLAMANHHSMPSAALAHENFYREVLEGWREREMDREG